MKEKRGCKGIQLYSFFNFGARYGWVCMPRSGRVNPGNNPVSGWGAPGPVRKGAKNTETTGSRSLDFPARNQSLYLLRFAEGKDKAI